MIYAFEDFELDTLGYELRRGDDARALLEPALAGIRGGEGTPDFAAAADLLASGFCDQEPA